MIRDLERLLKVNNHVIRYWEKEIPLIQPKKDPFGRHSYSDRDLQILLRLKHLLHERHFTVEGAREEIYRELSGEGQDLRAGMADLKSELLRLYDIVRKSGSAGEE